MSFAVLARQYNWQLLIESIAANPSVVNERDEVLYDIHQVKHKFLQDLVHVACSWNKACFELARSLMLDENSNME
jgi:hypothetical protein